LFKSAGTAPVGAWTNWLTDDATLFDSSGAVGLRVNADAAAISSCDACSGLPAACWMMGLNSVSAGSPGTCWEGIGCGAGSAAAPGQSAVAALDAMAAAVKPRIKFLVVTTVFSVLRHRWWVGGMVCPH
jgi:hypothetical protein